MVFNEEAGKFCEEGKDDSFEIISYGGYEPDSLCKSEFDFTNYDTAYELTVTCSESSGYSQYGTITAYDILKRPPVIFKPNKWEDMINCSDSLEVYECLTNNSILSDDTLKFLTDYFQKNSDIDYLNNCFLLTFIFFLFFFCAFHLQTLFSKIFLYILWHFFLKLVLILML